MAIQDHPRYAQINNFIQAAIPVIRSSQAGYFASKGRYFQGIKIPSAPVDGITPITADVDGHPADQPDSWYDFNGTVYKKDLKLDVAVQIHVYRAPAGHGWVLIVSLTWSGETWCWCHHEGTEMRPGVFDAWVMKVANG